MSRTATAAGGDRVGASAGRLAAAIAVAAAWLLASSLPGAPPAHGQTGGAAPAALVVPADPTLPVLVVREWFGELATPVPRTLRLYADGRCELERPPGMRGARAVTVHIAAAEAHALLRDLLASGAFDRDPAAVRARLRAAERARRGAGVRRHVLDEGSFEVEITAALAPSGRAAAPAAPGRRSLRWSGLHDALARHPADAELQAIASVKARIDALLRRPELAP